MSLDKNYRKGLSGLTRVGLEDEVAGLREDNAELRAEVQTLKAERDSFKAQVANLSNSDSGATIARLQKLVDTTKEAQGRAMRKAASETRRANFMQKQRDEARKSLENQIIEL